MAGGKPLAVWRLIQTSVRKRDLNITAPRQFLFLQLATSFDMRAFRRVQRIIASRSVFHLEIGPRFDRHQAGYQPTWFSPPLHRLGSADANALRTLACEIPNCRAIRDGVIPALNAARTAFT